MYMNLIIVIIIIKVKSTTHTHRATVLSVLIIHYAGAAIG